MRRLEGLADSRRRVAKGNALFRPAEAFHAIYAIRVGSFKTTALLDDGREQVAGIHLFGDLLGLEGIAGGRYATAAVALEDAEVCVIPFDGLAELGRTIGELQRNVHLFLSRQITGDHRLLLVLGTMRSEERVAWFLLDLSERQRRRGYSATELVLRVDRAEIGSHLGLKLETISRVLSRFQEQGLLAVQAKVIKLLDVPRLRGLCTDAPSGARS